MNNQLLDLFKCLGPVKLGSAIGVIAGPIAWIPDHLYAPLKRHKTDIMIATLL
jgi:hypothetical protein